ncbi:unnamed protein product [Zymoseptoria tritici ST99CH_3D7]|nr:unnamed protein product [Zymoseptoria tritici ST99CH_3D7]
MLAPPVVELAKRLTDALPSGLDKAVFFSTGSESNEAAIRLAKLYTGKFEVVALGQSWHGMSAEAQAAQYQGGRRGYGPSIPGQHMLPQPNAYRSPFRNRDGSYDWETELDYGWSLIDQSSCGSLAACLVECIQGDGGIHVLPPGYLKTIKQRCEARGMLLIVDEAQTGLGRTGKLFAIEHDDVVPDILTLSKPLANGLPLSAMVTSAEIDARGKEKGFLFFTTHTNEPLLAAVANTVLTVLVRDNLVQNAVARGEQLKNGFLKLKDRYACIGDVRGRGLMLGLEIVDDRRRKTGNPKLARALSEALWHKGVWCQLQAGAVFRIGPPITITSDQVSEGLRMMDEVFRSTTRTVVAQKTARSH